MCWDSENHNHMVYKSMRLCNFSHTFDCTCNMRAMLLTWWFNKWACIFCGEELVIDCSDLYGHLPCFHKKPCTLQDTFRGRVCACPLVDGVQFQGDGYTSCVGKNLFLHIYARLKGVYAPCFKEKMFVAKYWRLHILVNKQIERKSSYRPNLWISLIYTYRSRWNPNLRSVQKIDRSVKCSFKPCFYLYFTMRTSSHSSCIPIT